MGMEFTLRRWIIDLATGSSLILCLASDWSVCFRFFCLFRSNRSVDVFRQCIASVVRVATNDGRRKATIALVRTSQRAKKIRNESRASKVNTTLRRVTNTKIHHRSIRRSGNWPRLPWSWPHRQCLPNSCYEKVWIDWTARFVPMSLIETGSSSSSSSFSFEWSINFDHVWTKSERNERKKPTNIDKIVERTLFMNDRHTSSHGFLSPPARKSSSRSTITLVVWCKNCFVLREYREKQLCSPCLPLFFTAFSSNVCLSCYFLFHPLSLLSVYIYISLDLYLSTRYHWQPPWWILVCLDLPAWRSARRKWMRTSMMQWWTADWAVARLNHLSKIVYALSSLLWYASLSIESRTSRHVNTEIVLLVDQINAKTTIFGKQYFYLPTMMFFLG